MLSQSHLAFFVICLTMMSLRSHQEVLIEESTNIESLHAATGGTAELPCDVTPVLPDDQMGLVIWYKQGHDTPIYTLDTREGVTSHWSDSTTLGSRASFRSTTAPAVLLVSKLRPEDSGQYRCRVDFLRSPTKNTRLNLTVVIPPERLIILSQKGDEIKDGVIGPYDEGTEVNLTCVAVGGRPSARVSWWKSNELLSNSESRAAVTFTLERSDYGTNITCQAVTDMIVTPLSENLSIDMNLPPLWVRLLGGKRPLVAGQNTELVCQAVGARPKPNISWWKGGTKLNNVRETISSDGNVTSSILTFVPSIDDAGRVLSCRAVQPRLPHSTHEDYRKLEIQHLPVVRLELGANLDADRVVEGSDVYLDCIVRANPRYSQVYFTHNGAIVKPGPGVVLANQSLVLQRITRKAIGGYVCVAKNTLGEGYSDPLILEVKYAPTCKSNHATIVRAARGEVIDIKCDVDANPMEPMTYQWWFNSSTHSKLELNSYSTNAQNSLGRYVYTVNTSSDYGWVQCTGTNSVGRQSTPCLFHILPGEKPSSVKNCEITNMTFDSLTLVCSPGHDGGMKQSFTLQVYDLTTGVLLRNITSEEPQFIVCGLTVNSTVSISIKAFNKKGSSEPFTLTSNLLKHPQRHVANFPVRIELLSVWGCVFVAVCVIVILTAVTGLVFCWKSYKDDGAYKNEKSNFKQGDISNIPLTESKECEGVDSLDKNPDIIPIESKISDNSSNKSSVTDYSSIRPLLSKSDDKYIPICHRYDHSQYVQVLPLDFRVHQYQHGPQMPNMGQGVGLGPIHMPNIIPNENRSYDKAYEDWLKYKNSLPINTSGLLPAEHLMPPEPYTSSIHTTSSQTPLLLSQISELETFSDRRSPPVRVNEHNYSVYYNVDRHTHTLPLRRPANCQLNAEEYEIRTADTKEPEIIHESR